MSQDTDGSDPIWEFNAPQYVDFTVPQPLDDNADEWFDTVERVSGGAKPDPFPENEQHFSINDDNDSCKATGSKELTDSPDDTDTVNGTLVDKTADAVPANNAALPIENATPTNAVPLMDNAVEHAALMHNATPTDAAPPMDNAVEHAAPMHDATPLTNNAAPPMDDAVEHAAPTHDATPLTNDAAPPMDDAVPTVKHNIVASLSEWNKKKTLRVTPDTKAMKRPSRVVRKSPRYSNPRTRTSSTVSNASVSSLNSHVRTATPSAKRPKLTRNLSSCSSLECPPRNKRNNSLNCSTESCTSVSTTDSSPGVTGLKQHKAPKLTLPNTPSFMKRVFTTGNKVMSTEEIEYQKLTQLRKELAEKKKLSQQSYKKLQTSNRYIPMRSIHKPTVPQEFKFETDHRIKTHDMETRQDSSDFTSNLRQYDAQNKAPKKKKVPTATLR